MLFPQKSEVPPDYDKHDPEQKQIYRFVRTLFSAAQLTAECAIVTLVSIPNMNHNQIQDYDTWGQVQVHLFFGGGGASMTACKRLPSPMKYCGFFVCFSLIASFPALVGRRLLFLFFLASI